MKKENNIFVGWCVISPLNNSTNQKFRELIDYMNKNSQDHWAGCDVGDYYGLDFNQEGQCEAIFYPDQWKLHTIDEAWNMIFGNEVINLELIPSQKPLI